MASFCGYATVSNNRFQINYNITITLTLNFRQQVDCSIILYKVIHGPKFIYSCHGTIDRLSRYSGTVTMGPGGPGHPQNRWISTHPH